MKSFHELARRNLANLYQKTLAIDEHKQFVRRSPSQTEVEDWVAQAKEIPCVINY